MIRPGRGGRCPAAGRRAARRARACAGAGLAAVLTAGCGAASAPSGAVPRPPLAAVPTTLVRPSGSPSPVTLSDQSCRPDVPAISPMPRPGRMPAGTTMAKIQARGYLIAGVDQDSYAWGYPNPDPSAGLGEAYVGFDIDILHALAHAIFGNPDQIRFVPVTQDFRMGAAHEGIVDVVADSITITCPRAMEVRFSDDYFDAQQRLMVLSSNHSAGVDIRPGDIPRITGLTRRKVCTVKSTTSVKTLAALAKADHFIVVGTGNWSDCLVMLEQEAVQAISTDNTILGGLEAEVSSLKGVSNLRAVPNLKLVGQPFSHEPHGLAFPWSDPDSPTNAELVGFANGVLRSLGARSSWCPEPRPKPGISCWAALYEKWAGKELGSAVPPLPSIVASGERG